MVQLIDTNRTTGVTAVTGDDIVIFQGVTLFGSPAVEGAAFDTHGVTLVVDGLVYGYDFTVSLLGSDDGTNTGLGAHNIQVGAQGAIRSLSQNAVGLRGSGNLLGNHGEITAPNGLGVYVVGNGAQILNHGTIQAGWGILLQGTSPAETYGVINHGVIEGTDIGAIHSVAGPLDLLNTGTITSLAVSGAAIETDSTLAQSITNSGTIAGTSRALEMQGGSVDTIVNTGLILGDVLMGAGSDTFDGRGGRVDGAVAGGTGSDTYILDDASLEIVEFSGEGSDAVHAHVDYALPPEVEFLYLKANTGLRGEGNELANVLIGALGDDTLSGGQGDDVVEGDFGADLLIGGDGVDTASYTASPGWVNVSLLTGFTGGGAGNHALGDTLVSIENLTGSPHGDRLSGDDGANRLVGLAGDDILRGRGGPDALFGGTGRDMADYADSPGWVNVSLLTGFTGGGGGSHASGDEFDGIENLGGSRFADRLNGDGADNILEGRAGADTLDGNGGADTASYESSAGWVNVSLLTGFTGGGSGSHATGDVLEEVENLAGSAHDDILNGDSGANILAGLGGNDLLRGNGGADVFAFADGFGQDSVADWQDNGTFVEHDLFDFSGHAAVSAFGDLTVTAAGADAVISDAEGNTVTVTGAAGLIEATDFLF